MVIFDAILYEKVTWQSITLISIAFVHYVLGFHYLYKELFRFKNNEANQKRISYDDSRTYFFAEYDRCNPVTQASATVDFLKYLRKKNPEMALEIGKIIQNMDIKKSNVEQGSLAINKDQTEEEGLKQGLDIYANQKLGLTEYGE